MKKSKKFCEESNNVVSKLYLFFYQFCEQCDLTFEASRVSRFFEYSVISIKAKIGKFLNKPQICFSSIKIYRITSI